LARRDVWLKQVSGWRVEAREGDADTGRLLRWSFDSEADARTFVEKLLTTGGDGWRDITEASAGGGGWRQRQNQSRGTPGKPRDTERE
jgi:hypothetical protein